MSSNKKAPKIFGGLLFVIAIVGGVGYALQHGKESTDDAQMEGRVVPISSRITGQVQKVLVVDNQAVKAGDPLVEIDAAEFEARLSSAKADLAAARASLVSSESDLTAAESRLHLTETDLSRVRKLFNEGVLPRAELDAKQNTYDLAKSQYDQAVSRLRSVDAQGKAIDAKNAVAQNAPGKNVSAALAKVEQAEAALKLAEVNLSYSVIRAPIDGYVARKTVEPGQNISPASMLMAVVDLGGVWVVANFKEDQLGGMRPGQTATVKVDAFAGTSFKATVESFSPATGSRFSLIPPDNASGNFVKVVQRVPVILKLSEHDNLAKPETALRPGMNVYVTVQVL